MPSDQSRRNPKGPEHLGDSATRLKTLLLLGGPVYLLLFIAENFWYRAGRYGGFVFFLLLVPGNLLAIWGLAWLIEFIAARSAKGFATTVLAGGNLEPEPPFSAEESMIIQGRIDQAEASLRSRWQGPPPLYQAGLRLAELLVKQDRADEALAIFEELRRGSLPPAAAMTVANRLIDLHQKAGRTDRLKVELSRFAADHRGTGAGDGAARRLRELKDLDRKDEAERDD